LKAARAAQGTLPPAPSAPGPDLALETSRREASVALALGATVHSDEHLAGELRAVAHASDLLPRLERLLARAGVERTAGRLSLGGVFVGLGPGSYTGLRVGIATALGLARATGAPLFGLSSFEALAFAELALGAEGTVALDARAGRFYHARYRRTERGLEVLEAPSVCTAEELAERCARAAVVLGDPSLAAADGLVLPAGTHLRTAARPRARALLELGRARREAGELRPASALEPLYLAGFGRADTGGALPESGSPPRSAGR
jgi:tRNA threonylcarbamoyladenosine biosynthesis protein TsaB